MKYIKLQNYCFFFFEVYFEGGAPVMYTNQWSYEIRFFDNFAGRGSATLPKICSSASIFQDFSTDL